MPHSPSNHRAAKVHIRENATGEIRVTVDEYWSGNFQWQDGNYSCDCNRCLFFERAGGGNPPNCEFECSDGKYTVVKVEFEDGTEHPTPEIFNEPIYVRAAKVE